MRELTSHKANGLNDEISISVLDQPGPGGAHHLYMITAVDPSTHRLHECPIKFQLGGIQESGVNGISNEALLAIVEDRLDCFQSGPFATTENALALNAVRQALEKLHERTRERQQRGVEGKAVV